VDAVLSAAHLRRDEIFFLRRHEVWRINLRQHLAAADWIASRRNGQMFDPSSHFRRHRRQMPLIKLHNAGRADRACCARPHRCGCGADTQSLQTTWANPNSARRIALCAVIGIDR
jgi:hypothetical protein